jgi:hypothetical protein
MERLNIKIMLIQEYLDSALLLLTGLVATVLFLGDPGSFADQYISDLKEVNTVLELMSSGLHCCAFIVNRYITKASIYS